MVKTVHYCEKCGEYFNDKLSAEQHESVPIKDPNIPVGTIFTEFFHWTGNDRTYDVIAYRLVLGRSQRPDLPFVETNTDEDHNQLYYIAQYISQFELARRFPSYYKPFKFENSINISGIELTTSDILSDSSQLKDITKKILDSTPNYLEYEVKSTLKRVKSSSI